MEDTAGAMEEKAREKVQGSDLKRVLEIGGGLWTPVGDRARVLFFCVHWLAEQAQKMSE